MVKDGVFQFAISRPCGDEEKVLPIRELRGQERQKIAPLYEQLDAHMGKSPCFFPKPQGMAQSFLARENVSWRGL